MNKEWWKSKTLWINGLAFIRGVATIMSEQIAAGTTLTLATVINIVLRYYTKTELK